ncbi:hypothetical protein [Thalassotalea atypica]|uniref:hypothetical protein n=1 Tax=Thalassotalea atypica TaxID=2054316 RepID=UPI0025734863|nr:hypothetical protein [Thalassotalea atypica]
MKATTSARLLLIASVAIQSTALNASATENSNNSDIDVSAEATSQTQEKLFEQNSVLDASLSEQGTLEQLEQENAALDAMLKEVTELKGESEEEAGEITESVPGAMIDEQKEVPTTTVVEQELLAAPDKTAQQDASSTTSEEVLESTEARIVADKSINNESSNDYVEPAEKSSATAYNFERTPLGEGDIFIPIMADAKVFAEFVDKLPAVVNYYTMASEQDVINFYTESFGEPIEQERKRQRLTLIYVLDGASSRVVISQQDEKRQVDVIQEESF